MIQEMVSERSGRDLVIGDVLVSVLPNSSGVNLYVVSAIVRTETDRFAKTETTGRFNGPTINSDEKVLVLRRSNTVRFMRRFVKERFVFEEYRRFTSDYQTEEQRRMMGFLLSGVGSIHLTASLWRKRATSRDIGLIGIFLTHDGFIQTKIEGSVQDTDGIRYSGKGVTRGVHVYLA